MGTICSVCDRPKATAWAQYVIEGPNRSDELCYASLPAIPLIHEAAAKECLFHKASQAVVEKDGLVDSRTLRCPRCDRQKARVWRRQDVGKAGRHGLCFQSIAYGPEYHEEDKPYHVKAIEDCMAHEVDWRARCLEAERHVMGMPFYPSERVGESMRTLLRILRG